jgi:predicted DNA-binding transcriptional regulator AlpA
MNAPAAATTPDRKRGRPRKTNPKSPKDSRVLLKAALFEKHQHIVRQFDTLPDSMLIDNGAVAALESISMACFWKWVKKGLLPAPEIVGGLSRSNVGKVREYRAKRGRIRRRL